MICGDLERTRNTTTKRFVEYVDMLGAEDMLNATRNASCSELPPAVDRSIEVNWFAHGGYHPDAALPNSARACFSEDTYRCKKAEWTLEGVRGWTGLLKSQAGIGLEPSPTVYFESTALAELVAGLLKSGIRSIGTWGTFEQNDFKELWAVAVHNFLRGNASAILD
jgi:hypothetical protein